MRKVTIRQKEQSAGPGWGAMKPGQRLTEDSQLKIGDTVLVELMDLKYVAKIVGRMEDFYTAHMVKGGQLIGDKPSIITTQGFEKLYKPRF